MTLIFDLKNYKGETVQSEHEFNSLFEVIGFTRLLCIKKFKLIWLNTVYEVTNHKIGE
jgi:hypothetical protein